MNLKLKNVKLKPKLIGLFLLVGLIPLAVVGFYSATSATAALDDAAFGQLQAVRDIKAGQITGYFEEREGDIAVLSNVIVSMQQEAFTRIRVLQRSQKQAVERHFRANPEAVNQMAPGGAVEEALNEIMDSSVGLGETGESYLAELRDGRIIFRNDFENINPDTYVYGYDGTDIAPEYLESAVRGERGEDVFTNAAGDLVMVVFQPLDVDGITMAIVTIQNLEEALTPTVEGTNADFYTNYVEAYGYYDLFLIHPDGDVFYTVEREADYGTNILTGAYSDSSLAAAVTEALDTRRFGFGDFQPYAPSGDEPAAFVAQPLVIGNNVELVVALQMPLDQINSIMQERTGMGETGETYLVGPDRLMRSDSFLSPDTHSVNASFARPETGSVDTQASREALNNATDAAIIEDYIGGIVYSAYAPIPVYDTTWAIIGEIDEAEVRAPVTALVTAVMIVALVAAALVAIMALLVANMIVKPVRRGVTFAQVMAEGDLTAQLDVEQKDEIGILAVALQGMRDKLVSVIGDVKSASGNVASGSQEMSSTAQQLSQGATEQAASAEEVSASMEEMGSNIRQNSDNAMQTEKISQKAAQNAEEGGNAMNQTVEAMRKISEKINIIDDIARNTNLLALNAAIEAARAGEHGKGFAVVASEVRKLAERSQTAAAEIAELSTNSVQVAEKAGEMISGIIPDIRKTAELVQEISAASKEQNSGADQINQALGQLDQVVQQNASASEEMASMSEELNGQAEQLQQTVAFFKIDESASGARTLAAPGSRNAPRIAHAPAKAAPAAGKATRAPAPAKPAPKRETGISLAEKDKSDGGAGRISLDMGDGGPDELGGEFESF